MKIFGSIRFTPCTAMEANDISSSHRQSIHRAKAPFIFCLASACLCFMTWSGDSLAAAINSAEAFAPAAENLQIASATTDSDASTKKNNLRASYHMCLDASDGVTAKVLECISMEFAYQDALLNRTFRQLLSNLPPAQKIRLRNEEKQWLFEGDAACNSAADGGVTADLLNTRSCSLDRTANRADALEKMAENKRDR